MTKKHFDIPDSLNHLHGKRLNYSEQDMITLGLVTHTDQPVQHPVPSVI
uniref:Uncharacterized protein n=1 Tax=Anguilla anguilla TaxID=7936 RepID=A0A0E9QSE5_ANGAN